LLLSSIFWYSWKINKESLVRCKKNTPNFEHSVDINNHNEIIKIIESNSENILIYIQPIIDNDLNIDKYECLTRIKKKDWSIMYPYDIFNNIKPFPNLHYKFTSLQFERWFDLVKSKNISISLNVSTQDLAIYWEQFMFLLKRMILKYWKDIVSKITIEILEDNFFNKNIYKKLWEIKKLWFKIAIDDFWSWDSNYERLINFADYIDIIKIDAGLIKNLVTYDWKINKKNKIIVWSIINMSHELWFKVISEYVENEKVAIILNTLWNDFMQWYHFSKPFNSSELD